MKKFSLAVLAALVATSASAVDLESKSLDQLYQDALKEGGHLVVYAGGDTPDQQNGIKAALKRHLKNVSQASR